MTETSTVTTTSTVADHKLGTVGPRDPGLGAQDRRGRRDPRPRPAHLRRLLRPRGHDRVRRGRRGRLAAHRRSRLRRRRGLPHDHRPQEGHHDHRGRQEPHARERRERPQALPLDLSGRDARRPPPVPGRADHARPGGDRPLRPRARAPRGRRGPVPRAQGPRAHPGRARRRQRALRPGRADQEVLPARPRPLPGDGRAHADPQGQAQRDQRPLRARSSTRSTANRRPTGAATRRSSAPGCGARRGSSRARRRSGGRPCAHGWRRSRCRGGGRPRACRRSPWRASA